MDKSRTEFKNDKEKSMGGLSSPRPLSVGMIGVGNMGAWVAHRLKEHDADVCAMLSGRSAQTCETAKEIGIRSVENYGTLVEVSDIIISIVPSDAAKPTALEFVQAVRGSSKRVPFVDFNAVSSTTARDVSNIIKSVDFEFVDGSIMGIAPPLGSKGKSPRFYVSGPTASFVPLSNYGLDLRLAGDRIGAASSLKCCIAGLSKGFTAVAIETILAANSADVHFAMARELVEHSSQMSELLQRMVPDSFAKADRWVGEMNEIATELENVPGGRESFRGAALTFKAVAAAHATQSREGAVNSVEKFLLLMKAAAISKF